MDRELFKKIFDDFIKNNNKTLSNYETQEIISEFIEAMDKVPLMTYSGSHNVLIVIEELSELTAELTNYSSCESMYGIYEELADVTIGLDLLIQIFDLNFEYSNVKKLADEIRNKNKTNDITCCINLFVCHMASLIQQLTKSLRGKTDKSVIKELVIKCTIDIELLRNLLSISETEMCIAYTIKLLRAKRKIETNPNYS